MAAIPEERREVEVAATADVVVAGGGPSGLAAAVGAARAGAGVILLEQNAFLGGVATGAMMAALVDSSHATGIGCELIDRLADAGAAPRWPGPPGRSDTTPFDPEAFKHAALDMVCEAGVRLMLYTYAVSPAIVDGKVRGVVTESKSGRRAMLGTMVVDCTGDADIAVRAGAHYMKGRESDGKMRPFALLFRLGGLDVRALMKYAEENPDEIQPQHRHGTLLQAGSEEVVTRISGFYRLVEEAKAHNHYPPDLHYFRLENLWVDRGTAICNTTRVYDVDGADPDDLTRGQIAARRQIDSLVAFVRRYLPGGEKAFLIDVAPRLGVRETRRIVGEYSLTDEDAYADATFADAILDLEGGLVKLPRPASLDVHMPEPIEGSPQDLLERFPERVPEESHRFQVPYRVLVPRAVDNLLVAGRAISVSHMIDSWTRNMVICMHTGQVAGVAAALSASMGTQPRSIDVTALRAALLDQGVAVGRAVL
jgi:glycine/D-amino acid oxidase-like deaminating enzyme